MSKIRKQLCNICKTLKTTTGMTYDQILDKGCGAFHKSQLISIFTQNGMGVSIEVIEFVFNCLGGNNLSVDYNVTTCG